MESIVKYIETNIEHSPAKIVSGCVLVLLIVYSSVVPIEYKRFADSPLGRILGISIVYGVIHLYGWVYGILTAMAFLLILHGGISLNEGFDGGKISGKKVVGKRWWIERIMGEHPEAIETRDVITGAPGDT
jgi:hypothetical protein